MKDIPKIQRVSQAATSRSRKNTWLAVASPIHPFLCGPQRLERSGQLFTVTWLDAGQLRTALRRERLHVLPRKAPWVRSATKGFAASCPE